jgi:hypothetical protein
MTRLSPGYELPAALPVLAYIQGRASQELMGDRLQHLGLVRSVPSSRTVAGATKPPIGSVGNGTKGGGHRIGQAVNGRPESPWDRN